jgi:hypothetical protein
MGPIPLASAVTDYEKKTSVVEINTKALRENLNPEENILLQALDTITADKAEMVYATGEFNKVGGFELGEKGSISVVKFISVVGGLGKDAATDKAVVLRPILKTSRRAEIRLDLKKILAGQAIDFPLLPNDVLYVPKNSGKIGQKVGWVAVPIASGAIYLIFSRL